MNNFFSRWKKRVEEIIRDWIDEYWWQFSCSRLCGPYVLSDFLEEALSYRGSEKPLPYGLWTNYRQEGHVIHAASVHEETVQFYQCSLLGVTYGDRRLVQVPQTGLGVLVITYNNLIFGPESLEGPHISPTLRVSAAKCKRVRILDGLSWKPLSFRQAHRQYGRPCILMIEFVSGGYWLLNNFTDLVPAAKFIGTFLRIRDKTYGHKHTFWHLAGMWRHQILPCIYSCIQTCIYIQAQPWEEYYSIPKQEIGPSP